MLPTSTTITTTTMPHLTMDGKQYYEICKGRQADRRCFSCSWFRHLAHNCRNKEMVAVREKYGGQNKNRWKALRSHVMRCGVNDVARPTRGNVQQERRCWGCSKIGYCLWVCPKKVAHLGKGNAQQKVVGRTKAERMTQEVRCVKCRRKGMNTVWIPEKVARDKTYPTCEQNKGKRIDAVHPEKEEAQLKRSWWKKEEEARNRGWLRSKLEREWITNRGVVIMLCQKLKFC